MLNSLYCVLAQAEVQIPQNQEVVSSGYKYGTETICGVLFFLVLGIGIGIWIAYKNIKNRKQRQHHHHHHHSHHSEGENKEGSSSKDSEKLDEVASEPKTRVERVAETDQDLKENTEEEKEEDADDTEDAGEEEDKSSSESSSSSEEHPSRHRRKRRRRDHRPRWKTLAEKGGLPPVRPPGVPPPAVIKRDDED